jgi:ABC-type phosphate transport system permease subunit
MGALLTILLPLLPQLLAAIPNITSGVEGLIAFIASIRSTAKQTGQWTNEMETAFVESLLVYANSRAWKTDAEIAAGK